MGVSLLEVFLYFEDECFFVFQFLLCGSYLCAQMVHAAVLFVLKHPDVARDWEATSNNVVCVSVPGELELEQLQRLASSKGLTQAAFREPDCGGATTAVAMADAGCILSQLPLALRGYHLRAA